MASVIRLTATGEELLQQPVAYQEVLDEWKAGFRRPAGVSKRTVAMEARLTAKELKRELEYGQAVREALEDVEHLGIAALGELLDGLKWMRRHWVHTPKAKRDEGLAPEYRSIVRAALQRAAEKPVEPPADEKPAGRPHRSKPAAGIRYSSDAMIRAGVQVGVLDQGTAAWMLSGDNRYWAGSIR